MALFQSKLQVQLQRLLPSLDKCPETQLSPGIGAGMEYCRENAIKVPGEEAKANVIRALEIAREVWASRSTRHHHKIRSKTHKSEVWTMIHGAQSCEGGAAEPLSRRERLGAVLPGAPNVNPHHCP